MLVNLFDNIDGQTSFIIRRKNARLNSATRLKGRILSGFNANGGKPCVNHLAVSCLDFSQIGLQSVGGWQKWLAKSAVAVRPKPTRWVLLT